MLKGYIVYTSSDMTFYARDIEWYDDSINLIDAVLIESKAGVTPALELIFNHDTKKKFHISGVAESVTLMDVIMCSPASENALAAIRGKKGANALLPPVRAISPMSADDEVS